MRLLRSRSHPSTLLYLSVSFSLWTTCDAFIPTSQATLSTQLHVDWKDDADSNEWVSSNIDQRDWQDVLNQRKDENFWSSFEPSQEGDEKTDSSATSSAYQPVTDEDEEAELWLDALQSLTAEEVEFNLKEAERADKARQMEEWGFDRETIANTLDVATDLSQEPEDQGMQSFLEDSYASLDPVDLAMVESHTTVEKDKETGQPIRSQMVYVDEHTCIGCTNCAMIAQSTFFMHQEHGRARVFQQWGDDDETIQVAIETCPVDCIHYIPYDELVDLEVDRRDQNINFKARLVSQAENGNNVSHRSGGANAFTAPQKISGNALSRCNNCPSRGCKNCPMYGVGKNPEFERREQERKARIAKKKLQQERERDQKSAEL